MSQSGFIAAMLLAAFIIWLAINDRLTAYTAVLFGPTQQPTPSGGIYVPPAAAGGVENAGTSAATGAGSAGALTDQSGIIDTTAESVPGPLGLLQDLGPIADIADFL